jgi:protein transport protein SEC24
MQNANNVGIRPIFPSTNTVDIFERIDYQKGKRAFPPPDSLYTVKPGELDPVFLRSSLAVLHTVPRKISLPIGVWISPFANDQVNVVEVRSPLRCLRCKAYVNPYFQFDGSRRTVTCNLCGLRFTIEENIDRANIDTPDISSQLVIDFQVTDKFYMKKRTDIIKIFVVIELSMQTIELGIVSTIISSLKSIFESHEFEEKIRVGVVFYSDHGAGFIRKGEEGSEPIIFMVPNNKNNVCCSPLSDE